MTLSPLTEEVAHAGRTLRWPGLATPRPAPAKAWLAERLFRKTVLGLPTAKPVSRAGYLDVWQFGMTRH